MLDRRGHGLICTFTLAWSSCVWAGFTTLIPNPFGEPGPQQIISHVYQEPVTPSGRNFVGSTITATQLDDSLSNQALLGQQFNATAVARFSGNTQSYGVLNGGSFTLVFTANGNGYNVTGNGPIEVNNGESFGRTGNSGTDSAIASLNADGRVHVITYAISGAQPGPQYLQFWEDLNASPGLTKRRSKSDFNDLVVQLVPGSGSGGNVVPLPPAALSGAMLIASLWTARRLKRALLPTP